MKFCPLHLPSGGDDFTVGCHYPVRHTGLPYAAGRPPLPGRFSGDYGQRLAAGASPETMASSVATPLERSLGRIAGVSEMTSSSSLGSTRIILQFDFDRDINGAARDVQAAINAAQSLLPSGMPSRPTYRKANPSDAPIMILTLTSDTYSQGELYDFASTQLAPTISQIDGVGDVDVGGSSLPAVRVGLNPQALFNQGVSLDDVRTAVSNANVRKPQGALEDGTHRWQIRPMMS